MQQISQKNVYYEYEKATPFTSKSNGRSSAEKLPIRCDWLIKRTVVLYYRSGVRPFNRQLSTALGLFTVFGFFSVWV